MSAPGRGTASAKARRGERELKADQTMRERAEMRQGR